MVEISLSGSGEGLGPATGRGYSTAPFSERTSDRSGLFGQRPTLGFCVNWELGRLSDLPSVSRARRDATRRRFP